MKSLNHFAFGLVLIVCLALVVTPQTSVQASIPCPISGGSGTPIQYQYASVVAIACLPTEPGPWDFCLYTSNGATTPMEQVLTTYSSQGYALFSITEAQQNAGVVVLYTLRAPVTGAQQKASPVQ